MSALTEEEKDDRAHMNEVQLQATEAEVVIIRANIEHNMLGIIMGRGGLEDLGATLWGQTELSVYDDSMHGIWGMSYKYNERAIVFNQKNLIRLWDVAYDGYNGGKDTLAVNWHVPKNVEEHRAHTYNLNQPFEGASMMVMSFDHDALAGADTAKPTSWPSPIVFHDECDQPGDGAGNDTIHLGGEHVHRVNQSGFRVFNTGGYEDRYMSYFAHMPSFSRFHNCKSAGASSEENETNCNSLAFQGTYRVHDNNNPLQTYEVTGNGHHGQDFVGAASIRAGKGFRMHPTMGVNIMQQ